MLCFRTMYGFYWEMLPFCLAQLQDEFGCQKSLARVEGNENKL